jgi:hypothetical protein
MATLPVTALALPTVTLTLDEGNAAEAGQVPGSFTVTRANDDNPGQALNVRVALTGDATRTVDYNISPFAFVGQPNIYQITIAANETSKMVILTPLTDNLIEPLETAEFTLVSDGSTYTVGNDTEATIEITDDVAEVVLTLDDGNAAESGQDPGSFTVTRTSNAKFDAALNVRVALTGDAARTVDYNISSFAFVGQPNIYQITIAANETSKMVILTPILDSNEEEGDETAEFTLVGDGSTYTVGSPVFGIIAIADFTDLVFRDGFESP